MRYSRWSVWLLLLCLSVLLPVPCWSDSSKVESYRQLKTIFELQLERVESLKSDLRRAELELESLRASQRSDARQLEALRGELQTLKADYRREKEVLQSLRADLKESEEARAKLDASLEKAERSLSDYSSKSRLAHLKTGLIAGGSGIVVGILAGIIAAQ